MSDKEKNKPVEYAPDIRRSGYVIEQFQKEGRAMAFKQGKPKVKRQYNPRGSNHD